MKRINNTQIVIILLLSVIAIALLIIAFKPSSQKQEVTEQLEKTREDLLKEELEKKGYEVVYVYFSPTSEIAKVKMISLGSKYFQMIDGLNYLVYYYDKATDDTIYQVEIIVEDTTCYYRILNSVYKEYSEREETFNVLKEMFNEVYCFE